MMQRAVSEVEWRGHMTAWRATGGSLAAYARAHGLQPGAAYRWKRALGGDEAGVAARREELARRSAVVARSARVAVRFARVEVRSATPIEHAMRRPIVVRLELPGGRRAEIEVADREQLVTVIGALERTA
jgi:hypothetical protein